LTVSSEGLDAAAAGGSRLSRPAVTVTGSQAPWHGHPARAGHILLLRGSEALGSASVKFKLGQPLNSRGRLAAGEPSRFKFPGLTGGSQPGSALNADRVGPSESPCQAWPSVTDGVGRSVESPLEPRPGAHFSGIVAAIKFTGPPSQSSARSVSACLGRSRFGVVPGAGQGPHRRAHGPPGLA
jgi:hypothetical protein